MNLLSKATSNAKSIKNLKFTEFDSYILYLAPAEEARPGRTLCPAASPGCKAACLYSAGRGQIKTVVSARIRKSLLYLDNPKQFLEFLHEDIDRAIRKAKRSNRQVAIRLNGTSDIDWASHGIISHFQTVQFYDYTKRPALLTAGLPNYHVTLSASETNDNLCIRALSRGYNVAVVFSGTLPSEYKGYPVISGDDHDLRFLDPRGAEGRGVVIGLTAKGLARHDTSGFVRVGD